MDGPSPNRRFLVVALLGVLPWTVLHSAEGTSFVFSFGLVNTDPLGVTNAYEYFFVFTAALPGRLEAWALGIIFYAGAIASACAGLVRREDPRLTGGLLVLAGIAHARVAYGLYRVYAGSGTSAVVLPVGALAAWAVVWYCYWPLARDRGLGPL